VNIEKIGEAIQVLAKFAGGAIEPIRFRRHGRTYHIDVINARWVDRQAKPYALHYSVQVGEETCHIHFAAGEVQWFLDEVIVP